VLEPFRDQLQGVVVESTFNWYWLVDGLEDGGFKVILANPAAMKQYEGSSTLMIIVMLYGWPITSDWGYWSMRRDTFIRARNGRFGTY